MQVKPTRLWRHKELTIIKVNMTVYQDIAQWYGRR